MCRQRATSFLGSEWNQKSLSNVGKKIAKFDSSQNRGESLLHKSGTCRCRTENGSCPLLNNWSCRLTALQSDQDRCWWMWSPAVTRTQRLNPQGAKFVWGSNLNRRKVYDELLYFESLRHLGGQHEEKVKSDEEWMIKQTIKNEKNKDKWRIRSLHSIKSIHIEI